MSDNLIHRFVFSIIAIPFVLLMIFLGNFYFNFLLFIIFLLGLFEISKLPKIKYRLIIFFIFIIFLYSCVNIMSLQNGKIYIFLLLIITWLSDIGGYIVGKTIGGRKIKFISHNKTYTGFLGSILISQFALIYINFYKVNIFNNFIYNSLLIFCFTLVVIIGDLIFSFFKRKNNIKDYSNLLIGHGGLFDRIDGLIFLTIVFNIFINFI